MTFSATEASLDYHAAQHYAHLVTRKTSEVRWHLIAKAIAKSSIPIAFLLAKAMGQFFSCCHCDACTCVSRIKTRPLRQPLSSPFLTYQRSMNLSLTVPCHACCGRLVHAVSRSRSTFLGTIHGSSRKAGGRSHIRQPKPKNDKPQHDLVGISCENFIEKKSSVRRLKPPKSTFDPCMQMCQPPAPARRDDRSQSTGPARKKEQTMRPPGFERTDAPETSRLTLLLEISTVDMVGRSRGPHEKSQ